MEITDLFQIIAEQYGLVAVYALIVAWAGFQANSVKHLLMMLSIMGGVFVVMFQTFDLKRDLDVFGLAERFGLTPDFANAVAALLMTYVLGFAVFGVKRLFHRPAADA
mgnify:CR=1 FL=1